MISLWIFEFWQLSNWRKAFENFDLTERLWPFCKNGLFCSVAQLIDKLSRNLLYWFSNWKTELKLRGKHSDMLLSFFNPAFIHTWCTLVNCCLVSKLFNICLNFTDDFKPDYFSPLAFIVLISAIEDVTIVFILQNDWKW